MALTDKGIRWWSQHPRWGSRGGREEAQKQIGNADCIVTTECAQPPAKPYRYLAAP